MGADTLPLRDVFATLVSGSLALALVKGLETLAAQGTLRQVFQFLSGKNPLPCRSFALTDAEQLICRKIVHMSTGPLFVLTWPLFSAGSSARWCAASVPFFNGVRLLLIACGLTQSEATLKAVSRFGSKQELLRGPLLYITVVVSVTLLFWRESPVGLLALCLMCGGDGLADIVGRRYGSAKLPFNHSKSWVGSLAMFTGGGILSVMYIALFHKLGYISASAVNMMPVIWITTLLATVVEALPVYHTLDDNLTVPVVAATVGQFLMYGLRCLK